MQGQALAPPIPAKVGPPEKRVWPFGTIRTIVRNPIEAWPQSIYREPVVRRRFLKQDAIFLCDPDLIRQVLVDQSEAFTKSEAMRRSLEPALGDALLTAEGARWRWQRRTAAPIFRHDRILGFVPAMIEAARRTRDRWLALPPGAEIEVAREMMRTTFEIILETMLSGAGNMDVSKVERGITSYLDSTSWVIALTLLKAPAWLPYPGKAHADRSRDYLRSETLRIVAERRASGERRNDLITLLLEAKDPETGQAMTDREIADNLITFITAGHETTALALTWAFYLLSLHPQAETRIREEIETVTGGDELQAEHVDQLAFTRQVMSETMRLYPPAPVVVRTPVRDVDLGSEKLARGTLVYVPIYAVHRHEKLWDEPDRFDPERFQPDAVKARRRYAYLPFGAGPRICIGMSFALVEATVILAELVRATSLRLRPGYHPKLKMRITLRPAAGMPMVRQAA